MSWHNADFQDLNTFTINNKFMYHLINTKLRKNTLEKLNIVNVYKGVINNVHMGQTRRGKGKKVIILFLTSTCSPDFLRLKMVFMQTIHQRHHIKTFVRFVALV